jgi:hypothetical protein
LRDDLRRLITLTVTEPYSVGDILSVIDRQSAEDTWDYAMLYDLRAVTHASTLAQLQQMAARVQALASGRERGPVGMAVASGPEHFRMALAYTRLTTGLEKVEVLLTAAQLDDWLGRNARRGSLRQS